MPFLMAQPPPQVLELIQRFDRKVSDKWLCVVVKYAVNDAFVVTASLTDKLKKGKPLWPIK
jgi:hypothetical protein